MKKLQAIVTPEDFHAVKQALQEVGIERMVIDEVRVYDPRHATKVHYRGSESIVDFVSKVRIEVVVHEASLPAAVEALSRSKDLRRAAPDELVVLDFQEIRRFHPRQPEHVTN